MPKESRIPKYVQIAGKTRKTNPQQAPGGRFELVPSYRKAQPHLNDVAPAPLMELDYSLVREDFVNWLYSRVGKEHARGIISLLDRYAKGKKISSPKDAFKIKNNSSSPARMVIALRNLLNFAEQMELLEDDQIYKMRKVLKVEKTNPDNFIPSTTQILGIYDIINEPRQKLMFEILATSGIRIREAVLFVNNYEVKRMEFKENFARYPLFQIRHSKRAYYVYLPLEIAMEVRKINITSKAVERYFQKRKLPAKYLRKWNYNFLIMHNVPESVADFIQGRSPISIGSMHYLAKVKQADFWYGKIANEIMGVLEQKENPPEAIPQRAVTYP